MALILVNGAQSPLSDFMDTVIKLAFCVLVGCVIAASMNSLAVVLKIAPAMAPYPVGAGIGEVKANDGGDSSQQRQESMIPEMDITNQARPMTYATNIGDSPEGSSQPRSDLPSNW